MQLKLYPITGLSKINNPYGYSSIYYESSKLPSFLPLSLHLDLIFKKRLKLNVMKNLFFVFLLVLNTLTNAAATTPDTLDYTVVASSGLSLRTAPYIDSERLEVLPYGTQRFPVSDVRPSIMIHYLTGMVSISIQKQQRQK